MKKMKNRKSILLIVAGILLVASTQILNHYVHLSDFLSGGLIGLGLGLLIIALFSRRTKIAK